MNNIPDISQSCDHKKYIKIFLLTFIIFAIVFSNAVCGWFIAKGLYNIKGGDRYVSVKGLAEKNVKADLAIWNINFKAANDDLQTATTKIDTDKKVILAFLNAHGIENSEIEQQQTSVIDHQAAEFSSDTKAPNRYIINTAIQVRTDKVDLIRQVSATTDELIAKGVLFVSNEFNANPRYLFTKLDDIRPKMMEEATASARLVADQFASNSHSRLGDIKHASQGLFQILSPDKGSATSDNEQEKSINKVIRLVTSIDYFLVNK